MSKKEFVDRLYDRVHSITFEDDTYVSVTRAGDPDDQWDRDSTSTSHNVVSFDASLANKGQYFELAVPYEPEYNKDYYVLYAVYSSGDSFGHDDGYGIEYIGLYTESELEIANENQRRIEDHYRGRKEGYSVELLTPTGKTFSQHTPWIDYFGGLDYTDIKAVRRQK